MLRIMAMAHVVDVLTMEVVVLAMEVVVLAKLSVKFAINLDMMRPFVIIVTPILLLRCISLKELPLIPS